MNSIAEILERELEDAFEVKNKESLHRYVVFLAENIVRKSTYDQNIAEFRSDIKVLAETMKLGFESVDKRFETVEKRFESIDKRFEDMYRYMDKRFEDMNKRFTMMFTFMNIGFSILIIITILFKFLQ
ncbi:MAG: hypothetical protein GWP06_06165 [Actinobacteria bacterium]|nr:hypothetical protein [Actinomycetota bacterium]